jgi:uncharacterized membrane protein YeaQ/YmgE (transglycosylase-associated protein family)
MDLLVYLVFGALAGWIASMVMKTDGQQGWVMNIVVGVIGAFLGGMIMNLFGQSGVTGFNFYSLFVAILGAIVALWLYKMFTRRAA